MSEHTTYSLEQMSDAMKSVFDSGGEFRFYPRGTSMLPLIRQGLDSIALVAAPEMPRKRDILLYVRTGGAYVLHRVLGCDDDGYILCGDNQTVPEHGVKPEQIRGVLAAVYRGRRQVRCDVVSFRYRVYSTLWCFMPLRRFCLFVRRCVVRVKNLILQSK